MEFNIQMELVARQSTFNHEDPQDIWYEYQIWKHRDCFTCKHIIRNININRHDTIKTMEAQCIDTIKRFFGDTDLANKLYDEFEKKRK